MKIKLLSIIVLALIISACSSEKDVEPGSADEALNLNLAVFFEDSDMELADKEVIVEGNVVHTCRHSGKKMFIVDDEGNNKLRISTGNDISEFDIELEGSKVRIIGVVDEERVDENYLAEWESEVMAEGDSESIGEGGCSEEQPDSYDEEKTLRENQLNRINELRTQIKESSKNYISFYSVTAKKLEKIN